MKPSTEAITTKWNRSSYFYSLFSKQFVPHCLMMFNMLGCSEADSILEMGCGDGRLTIEAILRKKPDSKLFVNDIAVNMIKITSERVKRLQSLIKSQKVLGYEKVVFEPVEPDQVKAEGTLESEGALDFPELNLKLICQGNEDLSRHIQDASIDRVLASLSLHIVSEPSEMLKESFRVLKKGGQAMFSVWGQKENSFQFLLVAKVKEKYNIPVKADQRNSWHLNDHSNLETLVKEAGFSNPIIFENFVPMPDDSDEATKTLAKILLRVDWPEEKQDLFEEAIETYCEFKKEMQAEKKLPLGLNLLFVKVTKL